MGQVVSLDEYRLRRAMQPLLGVRSEGELKREALHVFRNTTSCLAKLTPHVCEQLAMSLAMMYPLDFRGRIYLMLLDEAETILRKHNNGTGE